MPITYFAVLPPAPGRVAGPGGRAPVSAEPKGAARTKVAAPAPRAPPPRARAGGRGCDRARCMRTSAMVPPRRRAEKRGRGSAHALSGAPPPSRMTLRALSVCLFVCLFVCSLRFFLVRPFQTLRLFGFQEKKGKEEKEVGRASGSRHTHARPLPPPPPTPHPTPHPTPSARARLLPCCSNSFANVRAACAGARNAAPAPRGANLKRHGRRRRRAAPRCADRALRAPHGSRNRGLCCAVAGRARAHRRAFLPPACASIAAHLLAAFVRVRALGACPTHRVVPVPRRRRAHAPPLARFCAAPVPRRAGASRVSLCYDDTRRRLHGRRHCRCRGARPR